MNVVVVGWRNSTAVVQSVIDSQGNYYALAVGPTVVSGALSQSIYYASNIAEANAGANSVTVTFSGAANEPDIRIVEYAGAAESNPVDVTAAKSGKGTNSSSGTVTTTNANDLLFGANIVTSSTSGAGGDYTLRISTPDGDIVEDRMLIKTGSHWATAPLSSGKWIMQMVAFRAASAVAAPPTAPSNLAAGASGSSQINLTWTASTGAVTDYVIAQCAGAGCTIFSQIATVTGCTYAVTGLAPETTYGYVVWAVGADGISANSNVASASTPNLASPPTAPANLVATAASSSQISLAWTASTSASGIAEYIVQRSQGGGASFVQVGTSASTGYNDSGLAASTSYSYRVAAVDNSGNTSAFSNVASIATQAAIVLAIAPASLNFENIALGSSGTEAVTLSNPGATSVTISAADVAGNEFSIGGLSLPLVLDAGESVNVNIVFTPTSSGTVTGGISFVSDAGNSPVLESLSGTGVHVVDLTWQASTSSVEGYYVYRGTVSGGPYTQVSASLVNPTAYSDLSVTAGQTYYYVVTAVASGNEQSAYSNEASATVPTP